MNFRNLTNSRLIESTHGAISIESAALTNVVRHFKEISDRQLYLARGYSSMFTMAMEEFGYDSSSALRRTHAVTLAGQVPDLLELIDQKKLGLQSAADIQTFLNKERGAKRAYTNEMIRKLVQTCVGLSTRDIQFELASRNPEIDFKETKKLISKTRLRITHTLSVSLEAKLERIKMLRSHVNPYMNREELLDYMAEVTLEAIDPLRKMARDEVKKEKRRAATTEMTIREDVIEESGEIQFAVEFDDRSRDSAEALTWHTDPKSDKSDCDRTDARSQYAAKDKVPAQALERSRYVTVRTKQTVKGENAKQGCCYVDAKTGRRCGSKFQEQFDHRKAFSAGGANTADNLQILCAKHNRYKWRRRSVVMAPTLSYA